MDIGQIQTSTMPSYFSAPVPPPIDPPPAPDLPIADSGAALTPIPDLPAVDPLPEPSAPEPPVAVTPPAQQDVSPGPVGRRSARELPTLGGIPVGQLKSLMKASENAQLLASALGVPAAPPLQLSVSIQNLYLGSEQVASATTLDIQA